MSNCRLMQVIMMCVISVMVLSCAGQKAKESDYSGFLQDYSQLQKEIDTQGAPVLRFVNPQLPAKDYYSKVVIEPTQLFPEPKVDDEESKNTLDQIKAYIDQALARELGNKLTIVEQPGPGTLRVRFALTGAGASAENLKPYQFIPVALVLTGARAAAGAHPERAEIFVEGETQDSVTGQRLAIAVRAGTGERLKKIQDSGKKVTLDSLKPLIDTWSQAYAQFLFEAFKL